VLAYTRIKADARNDLAWIHAMRAGVAVQLVEEGNPHRQIGGGEKLDRLALSKSTRF